MQPKDSDADIYKTTIGICSSVLNIYNAPRNVGYHVHAWNRLHCSIPMRWIFYKYSSNYLRDLSQLVPLKVVFLKLSCLGHDRSLIKPDIKPLQKYFSENKLYTVMSFVF